MATSPEVDRAVLLQSFLASVTDNTLTREELILRIIDAALVQEDGSISDLIATYFIPLESGKETLEDYFLFNKGTTTSDFFDTRKVYTCTCAKKCPDTCSEKNVHFPEPSTYGGRSAGGAAIGGGGSGSSIARKTGAKKSNGDEEFVVLLHLLESGQIKVSEYNELVSSIPTP